MDLAARHSIHAFWQTTRTLRVFLSHTLSGQPWQLGEGNADGETVNFETGQGIPAWSFKVEGRLLEVRSHPIPSFVYLQQSYAAAESEIPGQNRIKEIFYFYQEDDCGART